MPDKKTRGGARSGAGRKPLSPADRAAKIKARHKIDSARKMIRLTPEDVAAVELCAAAAGTSVHAWMVAAVRSALETSQAVVRPIEKPAGCP